MDAQTTEQRARELLDSRISSVRELVKARQHVHEVREQISEAEMADVKAYRAALADGWTPDELRKLGLDEPDKPKRVRRRASAARTAANSSSTTSANDADATAD